MTSGRPKAPPLGFLDALFCFMPARLARSYPPLDGEPALLEFRDEKVATPPIILGDDARTFQKLLDCCVYGFDLSRIQLSNVFIRFVCERVLVYCDFLWKI